MFRKPFEANLKIDIDKPVVHKFEIDPDSANRISEQVERVGEIVVTTAAVVFALKTASQIAIHIAKSKI